MATQKNSSKEFSTRVDSFIEFSEANNVEPSDYQLMKFLKISARTLDSYYANDRDADGESFSGALDKLRLYREDFCLRQVNENPKLAGAVAFKLKQSRWGGWTDKHDNQQPIQIDLKINGKPV